MAAAALKLSHDPDVIYGAAFALALSGDLRRSQAIARDLESRFPEDMSVQSSYLPVLRSGFALSQGNPAKAIDMLRAAAPSELGMPRIGVSGLFGALYPNLHPRRGLPCVAPTRSSRRRVPKDFRSPRDRCE
jgi:hypothetical protein